MAGNRPTAEDWREASAASWPGLAHGDDAFGPTASLHRKGDTFPGEVFMCLAADALHGASAGSRHVGGVT